MGWPMVRFGEIAPLVRRPIETQPEAEYFEVGVRSFGRGTFHKPPKLGSELGAKRLFSWKSGDLVFNIVFAWEGAVAIATEDDDGRVGSHRFLTCVVDNNIADARFLKWWFASPFGREHLLQASPGGAGRNRTLGTKKLENIEVPLPPLDEQRRIAARLDRVAALLEDRRRAAEAAQRETRALLLAEFARAIDGAPRRAMRDVAPLIRRPVEIDPDQTDPELGVRSFGRGTFHKPALAGTDVGSKKLFEIKTRDLLFNIVFAWEGAVAVAGPEDDRRVGSHRFLTCVPDPREASVDFLRFHFLTDEGLAQLGEASPGGAGRNRTLGLKKLETIEVPVPPIERQRAFDALQARAREIAEIRSRAETRLDALLPALLHEEFGECT